MVEAVNSNVSNMGKQDRHTRNRRLIGSCWLFLFLFFFSNRRKLSNFMEMKLVHISKHDCFGFIFNFINLHVDNDL